MLDHGAGTGLTTQLLLTSLPGLDVVLLDPNAELLSALPLSIAGRRVIGTADCLTADDGMFELVVSNLVLPFCSDAAADLRQMLFHTAPGGLLVATTLGGAADVTPFYRYWAAVADVVSGGWQPERYVHFRFGDPGEFATTVTSAGWRVESVVEVRTARRINATNAWKWVSSVLPTGVDDAYRALTVDEFTAVERVFLQRWSQESKWLSAGWTLTARAPKT